MGDRIKVIAGARQKSQIKSGSLAAQNDYRARRCGYEESFALDSCLRPSFLSVPLSSSYIVTNSRLHWLQLFAFSLGGPVG